MFRYDREREDEAWSFPRNNEPSACRSQGTEVLFLNLRKEGAINSEK